MPMKTAKNEKASASDRRAGSAKLTPPSKAPPARAATQPRLPPSWTTRGSHNSRSDLVVLTFMIPPSSVCARSVGPRTAIALQWLQGHLVELLVERVAA